MYIDGLPTTNAGSQKNLCNAKFSRIDVEKRVYNEVILSLHFSIASFNQYGLIFA